MRSKNVCAYETFDRRGRDKQQESGSDWSLSQLAETKRQVSLLRRRFLDNKSRNQSGNFGILSRNFIRVLKNQSSLFNGKDQQNLRWSWVSKINIKAVKRKIPLLELAHRPQLLSSEIPYMLVSKGVCVPFTAWKQFLSWWLRHNVHSVLTCWYRWILRSWISKPAASFFLLPSSLEKETKSVWPLSVASFRSGYSTH